MSAPCDLTGPWRKLVDATEKQTVTALAEALSVSRNTLYCWIRGERIPGKHVRAAVDLFAVEHKAPRPFGGK